MEQHIAGLGKVEAVLDEYGIFYEKSETWIPSKKLYEVLFTAVSISLDAEGDSSPFYADGIVYFRSTASNGYSGDLEIALIPEWFRTEILKEVLDTNGVLVEHSDIMETAKFALLFEFDGDIRAIRHVLYNCSASRPSIESETKEDSIEPGTDTLSLTADPRSDGLVKSRTGDNTETETYQNWYKTVYTLVEQAAG
jgi:phi13 family phage major tail protein